MSRSRNFELNNDLLPKEFFVREVDKNFCSIDGWEIMIELPSKNDWSWNWMSIGI